MSDKERRAKLSSLFAAANTGHFIGCTCPECAGGVQKLQSGIHKPVCLQNPLLLTAKLFLSEIRSWRENYQENHYVCTHFAKVVFDAATVRGIRCGFVTIQFENKEAHAVIAFKTDYGLVYFEPQTGDQEYVDVGRPYGSLLDGVPSGSPVESIDIGWNDQMKLRFVSCKQCGYLWPIGYDEPCPTTCPIDEGVEVVFAKQGAL